MIGSDNDWAQIRIGLQMEWASKGLGSKIIGLPQELAYDKIESSTQVLGYKRIGLPWKVASDKDWAPKIIGLQKDWAPPRIGLSLGNAATGSNILQICRDKIKGCYLCTLYEAATSGYMIVEATDLYFTKQRSQQQTLIPAYKQRYVIAAVLYCKQLLSY